MKILDYITNNPSPHLAHIAASDLEAEIFPLRKDCCIAIVDNSKMENLKKYEGFSMLLVSDGGYGYGYRNASAANVANVMISERKEDLIKAYCFLLASHVVSLNTSGSTPYDEVITALKLYKTEATKDLSDRVNWNERVQPINLDEKDIAAENEDEESLGSIDDEYYKN